MQALAREDYVGLVRRALAEDLGGGDATSLATIPAPTRAVAWMVARQALVVAGLPVAEAVFQEVSGATRTRELVADGARVVPGTKLLQVEGSAQAVLAAERVALNFVQHLSGVASLAAEFVAAVAGTRARILDTRKTLPGLRRLQKYAVACGGALNHRMGLYDMILIKDNHLAALRRESGDAVALAVRRARERFPALPVAVEADTLEQVEQAAAAGVDRILLDNMSPALLQAAVQLVGGRAQTETSGRVQLAAVGELARAGVDFISVGALTHSAPAVDVGLDFAD